MNHQMPSLARTALFRGATSALLAGFLVAAHAQTTHATTAAPAASTDTNDGPEVQLRDFIVKESALAQQGDIQPTSRPVRSVYGDQSITDVPRSVTVLTPALMEQFDIENFQDLQKIGAGTQQINYYGVPGTPSLRGARGGVFFDGMQRAFQRNEMPLSFGSVEAMDIVKGPAPAQFGAAEVGGYVNMIPKSPYFDRQRGSLEMEAGSYDSYRTQLDVGGPTLLFGRPAAYRVSLTGQNADSYYDRIGNDFVSLYGSLKIRLSPSVSITTGGEYFDFKSNENAGWNRVSPSLIDHGDYIIGEPISIVSPAWGGIADRAVLNIKTPIAKSSAATGSALVVPATVVDAGVSSGFITAAQRDAMFNLADPAQRTQVYSAYTPAQLAAITPSTSGYQYTTDYFAAGGKVFTKKISGSTVLSSSDDHANSKNLLYFADLDARAGDDRTFKGQFLLDSISTDKLSSYGYAMQTDQLLFEAKGTFKEKFDVLQGMNLSYGLSARYTDAKMLQDFFDEPFSRRDISSDTISPNSIVIAGPLRDPSGVDYWSPTAQGGANAHSKLWQLSAFAYAVNKLTESFTTYTSLLLAHAPYHTDYPPEVDRVPASSPLRTPVSGHRDYYSASFSPVFTVAPGVNLYATAQYGTSLDPLQGGAIIGSGNFARNKLLEAGVKTSLLENRLYASLAGYTWHQSQYSDISNNAELYKGDGTEFELTWTPTSSLAFIGSIDQQQVHRLSSLGYRTYALSDQDVALYGGVLNRSSFKPTPDNPGLEYPGTPETQVKLHAIVSLGHGFGISAGPTWSAAYWHNFDHTLRLPSSLVWNGSVTFSCDRFDVSLSIENITSEDYFIGAEPVFSANTLITKAPPANGKVRVTLKF